MIRSRARARSPALLLLAALLGLAVCPRITAAQADEDPIRSRMRQLRGLKREMEENRRKIAELQEREKDLGDLSERIRSDREMTARYLSELERQERALLLDLTDRQERLGKRTAEQERVAGKLRRRLRAYQRSRQPHVAELLLSSRSFAELFSRGALLARAIRRNRDDLLWLRARRDSLLRETSILESRRQELEALQTEMRRERERLERMSDEARREIAQVRQARERFEKRQKELAESEKRIQSVIARLEEERRARGQPAGPGLEGRRKQLPWPTQGDLIGRFGVQVHPRFKTKVPNKGIDIAAPGGTPIRAVAAGIAEFVDWLPGYGRCVILNHGDGYYTLYAHCRRVLVAQGMSVVEGQTIAEVGDTDSIKGNILHFEIRRQEKALNPEEWLR